MTSNDTKVIPSSIQKHKHNRKIVLESKEVPCPLRQGLDCNNSLSFIKTLYDTTRQSDCLIGPTPYIICISGYSQYVKHTVESWFPRSKINCPDIPLIVEIRDNPFGTFEDFVAWISSYDDAEHLSYRPPPKRCIRDMSEYRRLCSNASDTPMYIDYGTWSCLWLRGPKTYSYSKIEQIIRPDKYRHFTHAGEIFTLGLSSVEASSKDRRLSRRVTEFKWTDDEDASQVLIGRVTSTLKWLSKRLEYISVVTVKYTDLKE
jgi:hypothetical protein